MTAGNEPSIGGDKRIDTSGAEPKLGGEAAILHTIEMLEHTDRKVRYRAALKLAESGDDRVFDTLVEMLQDEDGTPRLRERAAMALGQLGGERAIDPLVASVGMIPAHYIIKVLAQIGGDSAADAVEEIFHDHWDEQHVLAVVGNSLAELGQRRVIELLIIPLENTTGPSDHTGFFASGRLKAIGSQIIAPVLPLLNHESSYVRRLTLRALSELNDEQLVEPLITLLEDEQPEVARAAIQMLGRLGDKRAVLPLLDLLSDADQDIAKWIIEALGQLGDPRAIEPLLKTLNGPNKELWGYAGQALVTLGRSDVVKILEKALHKSSEENAVELAHALADVNTHEAFRILELAIWQNRPPWLGEAAIRALAKPENPQSIPIIARALLEHSNVTIRRIVVERLINYPATPVVIDALVGALGDRDDYVRWSAARSLREVGDSRAVEPLLAVLDDRNDMVREWALFSLGEIGDPQAVESLINIWNNDPPDENEKVPAWAAKALGKIGDKRAVEPLVVEIVNRGWLCREYAAEALGRLGDSRAVEPLIEILTDFDDGGCRQAAKALGKLGDERAVEALKAAMFWADRGVADFSGDIMISIDERGRLAGYNLMLHDCREALEKIGTPEALAAIEDLPFRDLGD